MAHPLVLVGLGALGHRVVSDLRDTTSSLPTADRAAVSCLQLVPGPRGAAALRDDLLRELEQLLRAGAVRGAIDGRARLDIVLIGSLDEGDQAACKLASSVISDLLVDEFSVLFPPSSSPEQRSVWLSLAVCTPPLSDQPDAAQALQTLTELEAWAGDQARHPALSRVWLLPRQTSAGRLSDDVVERSLRCFVQALFLSGVRMSDAVQRRMKHRNDQRFIGMISVAAAELPVARLRRYARWRAAWDGLCTLVDQAERPTGDPARAEALVARVDVDDLLEPFREGAAAQRTRKHAATLSGATDRLPDEIRASLLEREDDVRHRYRALFGPLVKPAPDRATDAPDHAEVLRILDATEANALSDAQTRLQHLLDHELDPRTALQVLPHLESALHRVCHRLEEELHQLPPELPAVDPPPPPEDPGRDALEYAVRARPGLLGLLPTASGLAFVAGVFAAMSSVALMVHPDASVAGGFSSATGPVAVPLLVPALTGASVALVVGVSWTLLLLHRSRVRLVDQLLARRQELEDSWSRGGGGQPGRQAQALLDVRRRRATAGVLRILRETIGRLAAARASLRGARDNARRELERLRVRLGTSPLTDDIGDVLGPETPLHHPLVSADIVVQRVHAARTTLDPARWAQVLLEGIWPAGGLVHDLPGADEQAVRTVSDAEIAALGADVLLRGDAVAPLLEQRLHTFFRKLGGGLAWGVVPRDQHGDPLSTVLIHPQLCVAPIELRPILEPLVQSRPDQLETAWGSTDAPWVVVLATWDGLDMNAIRRGARASS
ncbi:MAG: hypothetical protein ACI9MC_001338 [Kiritimatiellia bacterium]